VSTLDRTLKISEIFKSIQGESRYAGFPCSFIRLFGCPLRCIWCDTVYSYTGKGELYSIGQILQLTAQSDTRIVEITGGEPLLQENVYVLIDEILKCGKKLLIETSGALPIDRIDRRAHIIMDLKCPDSGESHRNVFDNIAALKATDEIKFVVASRKDYLWAKDKFEKLLRFSGAPEASMSPASDIVRPSEVAGWILEDKLPVRLNLQWHKYIWPDKTRAY